VYRTAPESRITHLVRVESHAARVDLVNEVPSTTGYECAYAVLATLPPIGFADLKKDPALAPWPALRKHFVGSAHPVPTDAWAHLLNRSSITPQKLRSLIAARIYEYEFERDLEDHLVGNADAFTRAGLRLTYVGRQRRFKDGGIADLIYRTRSGRTVIVELKRGPIDAKAVEQVRRYRGSMQQEKRSLRRPLGILVGQPPEPAVSKQIHRSRRLRYVDVAQLGLCRLVRA
jgi:hypothetical protein